MGALGGRSLARANAWRARIPLAVLAGLFGGVAEALPVLPSVAVLAASSSPVELTGLSADDPLTFRERMARHEANALRAERDKDLPALSFALSNVCGLNALVRYAVIEPVCARSESIARQSGRPDLVAFAMGMRADAHAWLGQLERARTLGLAALEENPPPDTPSLAPRSMILEMLGTLAFETGQPERALEYLNAAEVEAARVGWRSHVGWIAAGRGRLHSFLGDYPSATEDPRLRHSSEPAKRGLVFS